MQIKLDDNGLTKFLSKDFKKQLPFAQSMAINGMAFETMNVLRNSIDEHLNTTRKFLHQSIQVEKATKKDLVAEVGFLERVTFADRLLDGGTRTPFKAQYLAIPINVQRTKRGGISKAKQPSVILKDKQYFIKKVNGTSYIFKKLRGGKISAMYVLKRKTEYNKGPYFPFEDIVNEFLTTNRNYEKRLYDALNKAFKTRKK